MADNTLQLTTHELWIDGRAITLTAQKTTPTTLRLSWNTPTNPRAYDGAVVLLSEKRLSSSNFPVDGTRYVGSSNWTAPAMHIDGAQVVAAFYGFFGDVITQTFVDVTNIDPTKLYYASIHAASNVLQYYTVGCQSYPLESSRFEKQSETYAGSIPSAIVPPENPVNGQAYFDPETNIVLVWNDAMAGWVKGTQDTVPVGQLPPITANQLFWNTNGGILKYFNGTAWVPCDATNTLVKMGAAWAPFNSASQMASLPATAAIGDFAFYTTQAPVSAPGTSYLKFFSLDRKSTRLNSSH